MSGLFCAHRGVSALLPENTLPAFAAAYALGADEIEFDVRLTKDAQMIVSHDGTVDRISDGHGEIPELTLNELREMNLGGDKGWQVGFCTPKEVFDLLGGRLVMNIHLKEHGEDGYLIRELQKLAERHGIKDSIYFAGSPAELEWMRRLAPEIRRDAIQGPWDTMNILDMVREYDCFCVQFWLGMFDQALIDTLHAQGVRCNLFYADTEADYDRYFAMGIDNLLTNRMDLAARYRGKH